MNWEDVATGVIGHSFGLGPTATAVAGAARYAAKMRKIGPGYKRQRTAAAGIAPSVNVSSVGVYKGDFYKRGQPVGESAVTQYGFQRETEHYGVASCPDVQYIGVQSVNAVMAARGIAVAYLRMIFWRHFKQTYASEGDLLYQMGSSGHVPELQAIVYITGVRDSTGLSSVGYTSSPTITSTTTLNDLVIDLQSKLEGVYGFGLVDYTGAAVAQPMLVGYQLLFGQVGALTGCYSPIYYTDHQKVRYTLTTVVQLQNQTLGDNGSRYRDDIATNPIVGKVFTTHGLYPLVEKQYRSDWDTSLSTNTDVPSLAGVMLPSAAPVGAWRSIPTPQVFSNIIKCEAGLRIEPGEIKKDVLKFSFYGTMRALFDGLRVNQIIDVAGSKVLETDYTSSLGYNKLYAFEKVVPTGVDQVVIAYHLDRYHTCLFGLEYFQNSCRREYARTVFNRTIAPALLAAPVADNVDGGRADVVDA